MPYYNPWNESAINLDRLDYDAWLAFVFDHPVSKSVEAFSRGENVKTYPKSGKSWWRGDQPDYKGNTGRLMGFATRLFRGPTVVLDCFTHGQAREGLWFLASALDDWLWDYRNEEISLPVCEACIQSMYDLFDELFSTHPLGDTAGMWWDFFRTFNDRPDPDILNIMFETLCRLLDHESDTCCGAALHGLGHLPHNGKEEAIRRFLARRTDLDADWHRYAEAAIVGKVL